MKIYSRSDRVLMNRWTKFSYIQIGKGHVTVASTLSPDRQREYFGLAWCSPKDQFTRSRGRVLAKKRLFDFIESQDSNFSSNNKFACLDAHIQGRTPYERAEILVNSIIKIKEGWLPTMAPEWIK